MASSSNNTKSTISKKRAAGLRKQAESLRFTRRSFSYIARTLAIVGVGLVLCVLIFVGCARLSSTYIIVNEGMGARAEYILQEGSVNNLKNYFTEECLLSDSRLSDTTYKSYTVGNYSYVLSFERIRVWPWLSTLSVDVIEEIRSISGTLNGSEDSRSAAPPSWTPIKYRLTLENVDGSWRISSLTTLEVNPTRQPEATSDPSRSPLPMATPTPTLPMTTILVPTPGA